MTIVLSAGAEAVLFEKNSGSGGFQSLLEKLRKRRLGRQDKKNICRNHGNSVGGV